MQAHKRATEWFDDFYKQNEGNHEKIPWANKYANTQLVRYLNEHKKSAKKALVIGCGLGDDAYALASAGYEVTAIDISKTALSIARERFSDAQINFEVQDIFDMPTKYEEYFDFVFESLTIQSLPLEFREKIIKAVAKCVAKEGELLLVAHKKNMPTDGPPWPLTQEEVNLFKQEGLKELESELVSEDKNTLSKKFRVLYSKMQ